MRKRWYLRLIGEGYGLLLSLIVTLLSGIGVVAYLVRLTIGRSFLAHGGTAAGTMTANEWWIFAVCCVLLVACARWFITNFVDLFFPGGRYEGIVDTIDLVHVSGTHGSGYHVWKLTSGDQKWDVSKDAGTVLSVGDEIRVTYRRGSGVATHIWRRRSI